MDTHTFINLYCSVSPYVIHCFYCEYNTGMKDTFNINPTLVSASNIDEFDAVCDLPVTYSIMGYMLKYLLIGCSPLASHQDLELIKSLHLLHINSLNLPTNHRHDSVCIHQNEMVVGLLKNLILMITTLQSKQVI